MIWCFLLYYFARRRGIQSKIPVYFQTFFYKYLKTFNLGLKKNPAKRYLLHTYCFVRNDLHFGSFHAPEPKNQFYLHDSKRSSSDVPQKVMQYWRERGSLSNQKSHTCLHTAASKLLGAQLYLCGSLSFYYRVHSTAVWGDASCCQQWQAWLQRSRYVGTHRLKRWAALRVGMKQGTGKRG